MNISEKVIIKLDESDVKKIIADYLTREKDYKVKEEDVRLDIGTKTVGYGTAEHEEVCFKGIVIELNGGK